jgi:hypothetical protein
MMNSNWMKWAGHSTHMGDKRTAYRVLVGKPEGQRPLRTRNIWEHNIKMDLREIGWGGMEWINFTMARDQ